MAEHVPQPKEQIGPHFLFRFSPKYKIILTDQRFPLRNEAYVLLRSERHGREHGPVLCSSGHIPNASPRRAMRHARGAECGVTPAWELRGQQNDNLGIRWKQYLETKWLQMKPPDATTTKGVKGRGE